MENEGDIWIREIDAALKEWCQGDYVLGKLWFIQRCDPGRPLTEGSKAAATEGIDLAEVPVPGFVVITQTCDIVRSCKERPFIEVSPLFEVDRPRLSEIQKARPSSSHQSRIVVAELK